MKALFRIKGPVAALLLTPGLLEAETPNEPSADASWIDEGPTSPEDTDSPEASAPSGDSPKAGRDTQDSTEEPAADDERAVELSVDEAPSVQDRVSSDATNEMADAQNRADPPTPVPTEMPGGRPSDPVAWSQPTAASEDGWAFRFNGFIRAPMRIGIGKNEVPADGQSSTTLHYPVIPDDQYLSWQYTRQNPRDWAELFFTYGNDVASATVALSAFQFTDAAWNNREAQFGISQGYVLLTPKFGNDIEFWAKVGSIWDDYGGMGRWDAGQYDTYVFGRTAIMGETLHIGVADGDVTYAFEQGLGTRRPDPSIWNQARFTLVHHEHAYITWDNKVELSAHYLYSWAAEEDRDGAEEAGFAEQPNGSMSSTGVGLRFTSDELGYLFVGYSRVVADAALTVGPGIEVINSAGGGGWDPGYGVVGNYLQGPEHLSQGTGTVDTVAAQYDAAFDNGAAKLIVFGMMNFIASDDPAMNDVTRLKYGADFGYSFLPWLGGGLRYDRLQPNNKIAEQSFSIISPRIVFRSSIYSHEQISLQYARYFYNQRTCSGIDDPFQQKCVQVPKSVAGSEGFGALADTEAGIRGAPTKRPDINVITLTASMWW